MTMMKSVGTRMCHRISRVLQSILMGMSLMKRKMRILPKAVCLLILTRMTIMPNMRMLYQRGIPTMTMKMM